MPAFKADNGFALSFDAETGAVSLSAQSPDGSVRIEATTSAALGELDATFRAMEAGHGEPERVSLMPMRAAQALDYYAEPLREIARWVATSRETTNFTYDLSSLGLTTLAHAVALATGKPVAEIRAYLAEPGADAMFLETLRLKGAKLARTLPFDPEPRFGRRLGWYAAVRALKPGVVLESGVDKGLGAMLLCYALERNAEEGHPGRYLGLDINPAAGALLAPPYDRHAELMFGDALASIARLADPVDLYINDGDHRPDYELREYQAIAPRLASGCMILGDNCHATDALPRFAEATGRNFFFWREQPAAHWYPGAGIGFAFPAG